MRNLVFVLLVLVGISFVFAVEAPRQIFFEQGENVLNDTEFEPIYVKDLVALYPEIESVSYEIAGTSYGYVNVFGGIGTNFVVMPGIIYEIDTRENVTISLR